jgi:hypothetical protein
MGEFVSGHTRLMKVLVCQLGMTVEGHRAYPVAWNDSTRQWIVVAATEGDGFTWGRLYLVAEGAKDHHPFVLYEAPCVPHDGGWKLTEAIVDDGEGREDPY